MVGPFEFFKGGAIFLNRSLPQVLREWCALYVLTSTCASRRSRMHFFNKWTAPNPSYTCFAPQRHAIFWFLIRPDGSAPAALASPLFDPPGRQNIGKTQWFATFFYLFTHFTLLSSDLFSSLIFFFLPFSSLTLPTSAASSVHIWLLNFLRWLAIYTLDHGGIWAALNLQRP